MKKEKLFNGKAFLWAIIATIMAAIYNSSLTRVRDFVGRTYVSLFISYIISTDSGYHNCIISIC